VANDCVEHRASGFTNDLEIELHPDAVSADERERSVREVRALVHDFIARDPAARRAVLDTLARLGRLSGHRQAYDFDFGSVGAHALAESLVDAARSGIIVARRRETRRVVVPLDIGSEPVLGPSSEEKHTYTVLVLDDTGAPVAGAKLELDVGGEKQELTTDGSGKVTVDKTVSDTATVTLTNRDSLVNKLWSQWKSPLSDKPYPGDQIAQALITQPIAPFRAPADWHVTLVLLRPPIWRVRVIGMIFDGDKSFLLPQALEGIKNVVAMHKAHPDAKVLIVGHEGGDELEGSVDLALGRAKILADYLTSKSDDWLTWFGSDKSDRQRWGVREVQLMLSAVTRPGGKPFYDGSSPGVMDDRTVASLKAFQTANGLTPDGKPSAATRKALVTQYMAIEDTSLTAGVEPVSHGCTGHEDDMPTADGLPPDDRRLEVLFFDTAIQPPPSGDTSDGGSPEYPAWRTRLVQTDDFENHGIHVQIVDTKKQPMPLATVHLDGPAPQDTVADEHGFVTFWGLVAGEYTVSGVSRTGIALPPTKLTYPTAKTIMGARALPTTGRQPSPQSDQSPPGDVASSPPQAA
jgi:outer membrane protein OmpA-like peptidoglycan-associated protein